MNKNDSLSAYDFLALFSAIMYSKDLKSFDRYDLLKFLHEYDFRVSPYWKLTSNIIFNNNHISSGSDNLDKAYNRLMEEGVFYTVVTIDGTIFIKDSALLDDISFSKSRYFNKMERFVDEFIVKFVKDKETTLRLKK